MNWHLNWPKTFSPTGACLTFHPDRWPSLVLSRLLISCLQFYLLSNWLNTGVYAWELHLSSRQLLSTYYVPYPRSIKINTLGINLEESQNPVREISIHTYSRCMLHKCVYPKNWQHPWIHSIWSFGVWRWGNEEGASKDEETLDFASTQWSSYSLRCPTLCDPMNCSPPGSSVHGILQGRILEWISLSLLQGIFPIQGSNRVSCLHCRRILYRLSHQGKPNLFDILLKSL